MSKATICDLCGKLIGFYNTKYKNIGTTVKFKGFKYLPDGRWKYYDICIECIKKIIKKIEKESK